ncbi:hypothetical protein J437_LFUL019298 [Ladona fulva]|uniref:Uncharacterized protein n=1 Tax=Ladona fulva TaxID=123851 RepID=A0A8K0KJ96_LADFU|nr:hypothetical protein J437_LFUL019298 [Ladona fulva]
MEKRVELKCVTYLCPTTQFRDAFQTSMDVMEPILSDIKAPPVFSFQLDESIDVSSCSQLLVFVRYIHLEDIKEEFLFCRELKTTTKGKDLAWIEVRLSDES